jgi:hypothetical protein
VVSPADREGDGVADEIDDCPLDFDPLQTDTDGDGTGDACEPDPGPPWRLSLSVSPFYLPPQGGKSVVMARVYDEDHLPVPGVDVFFSTTSGWLESRGEPVVSDLHGTAKDVLHVRESGIVTGESGAASGGSHIRVPSRDDPVTGMFLHCSLTEGLAPLDTACSVVLFGANRFALEHLKVYTLIEGDLGAFRYPARPEILRTNEHGFAGFNVRNVTVDGTMITVSSEGHSRSITLTILP